MTKENSMTVALPASPPEQGQLVNVRQRQYVVTEVAKSSLPANPLHPSGNRAKHLVSLSSIEDDALGEELQVIWEIEPGAQVIDKEALPPPRLGKPLIAIEKRQPRRQMRRPADRLGLRLAGKREQDTLDGKRCLFDLPTVRMGKGRDAMIIEIQESRMDRRRSSAKLKPTEGTDRYTTKIIKAGALLADTKMLLAHWDSSAAVKDNLDRVRRQNLFGKASRSRVEDILAIFRQRYLVEQIVTRALVTLVQNRFPTESTDRILYFHAAKADPLLHDVITEVLVPLHAQGHANVTVEDIRAPVARWVSQGKATSRWSDPTLLRVVQGLLATLRDFGVLQGAVHKRIAPSYLPVQAFAYVAFYLKQHQPSGAKLLDDPDWKLFFLSREGVERFLVEAHQRGLLEFHAAGTVVRISVPAESLEEYAAHVLAQRAH
jgi:hypothetical protein